MKVAVTGPNGRLASWLIAHHGCIPLECNISKYDETRIEIQRTEPDVIINCAAYTHVDKAEEEEQKALLANVRGPGNVRMAFSGLMVHVSTSYVFDGNNPFPYTEEDKPAPLNEYGWSKWGGEVGVLSGGSENCLIARVISLYGPGPRPDFVSGILSQLSSNQMALLPDKLMSNPTYIPHLSEALMWCIKRRVTGILNLAGTDIASRFVWAKMIAKVFGMKQSLVSPTAIVHGAALRPKNQALDLSKAKSMGVPLYSMKKGLKELKKWDVQRSTSPR